MAGAGVMLKREGKILLQLRDNKENIANPNCWGIFGGSVMEDETPEQTAIREIKEELGIILSKEKLSLILVREVNNAKITFFGHPLEHEISEIILNEGQEMELFSKEEILELKNTAPGLKKDIEEYWSELFHEEEKSSGFF